MTNALSRLSRVSRRWAGNLVDRTQVFLCGGLTGACARVSQGPRPPNVILITLDSLRADRLGYLSGEANLTPNLDALADESVRFTKAIAQAPWTKPSVGSMLTGFYPSVHGANTRGAFGAQVDEQTDRARANVMRSEVVTLAEVLLRAGYTTAAFTGGGFAHAVFQGQGFQTFYSVGHGLQDLFYRCASWFASGPDTPFFVWLHAYDTHRPYWAPIPFSRFLRRSPYNLTNSDVRAINTGRMELTPAQLERLIYLYDRGVRYADRQMGRLLRALSSSGLLEQSILVFTSDHGEALYEHRLVEHSDVIYNEVLQVPLIVRAPGIQPRTVDQYVRLMDLMPTILELVGVPAPQVQGVSLRPAMLEGRDLRLSAFSKLEMVGAPCALQLTLAGRDYKFIRWTDTGRTSFFDLTASPGEEDDLSGRAGPMEEELRARLDAQLEENEAWAARFGTGAAPEEQRPGEDREVEQRLRDLGYIE